MSGPDMHRTDDRADVVVVGAGASGAVVAATLSAAGADVLLLEAGPDYRSADTPAAVRGRDLARALATRTLRWESLEATTTTGLRPRPYVVGRGVGGSSAINGQLAVRGLRADFDRWATVVGPGWSWATAAARFAAFELSGSPVPVSRPSPRDRGPVSAGLHAAALAAGHHEHPRPDAAGSTGVTPAAWHRLDGQRVTSNDSFLEPARSRSTLRVQGECVVDRVLVRQGRAVGVEMCTSRGRERVSAGAVVLSAGAVHSPTVLLRSGLGPAGQLRQLGVEVHEDLPGVGAALADHPGVLLTVPLDPAATAEAAAHDSGTVLVRASSDAPPGEVGAVGDLQLLAMDRAGPGRGGLLVSLMRPTSTGTVRLRSTDPGVEPQVHLGLLVEDLDRQRLAAGVRHGLDLLDHPAMRALTTGPGTSAVEVGPTALRERVQPLFHPSGTCRAGEDGGTVVDGEARVHGVDRLWVVDASILPDPCGVPPYLTLLVLAGQLGTAAAGRLRAGP